MFGLRILEFSLGSSLSGPCKTPFKTSFEIKIAIFFFLLPFSFIFQCFRKEYITRVARNLAFARKQKGAHFWAFFIFCLFSGVWGAKKAGKKERAQPWYARRSGKLVTKSFSFPCNSLLAVSCLTRNSLVATLPYSAHHCTSLRADLLARLRTSPFSRELRCNTPMFTRV